MAGSRSPQGSWNHEQGIDRPSPWAKLLLGKVFTGLDKELPLACLGVMHSQLADIAEDVACIEFGGIALLVSTCCRDVHQVVVHLQIEISQKLSWFIAGWSGPLWSASHPGELEAVPGLAELGLERLVLLLQL